jgi:hypothetical protein
MSQRNIQNENFNQNSISSDMMTNYLQNQRPKVIMDNDNEPIIIGPLNTDIRFNAYNSNSEHQQFKNHNNNRRGNKK